MLDEFTALGRVEIVPVAVGWVAGYGIRIVIVIQSIAQLESVYGADTARGLITNLGVRIVFTHENSAMPRNIRRCWARPPCAVGSARSHTARVTATAIPRCWIGVR
ncbi:type IV secretory system conjugative DNA transfer family protein [Xanthomonas albilineans]|uniref:type IV secretory system conjugative DNA transfer family protein n=1 Tax=Xanthomonas albilineans TaxID=29447 RepID=UPI0005F349ED